MDNLTAFIQLFTLTDQVATKRLTTRLALVLRDPAAYKTQYTEEMEERGVHQLQLEQPSNASNEVIQFLFAKNNQLSIQELRDIALIDGLISEDLAWEVDWQDEPAEIAGYLNETLVLQQRPLLDEENLATRSLTGPDALDAVQDALEAQGLALVLLTLDGDSYPLSVVADADAEATRTLAAALGFRVAVY